MTHSKWIQAQYLQQEEVWKEFVAQIKKDAMLSGIEWKDDIFQYASLDELIQQLEEFICQLIRTSDGIQKMQGWLYRVDVPEGTLNNQMPLSTHSYSHTIAELIIKRTLQKVVIRYLHKRNEL